MNLSAIILVVVLAISCASGAASAATGSGLAQPDGLQWWQRGQDTWSFKDDWNAKFLRGGKHKQTYTVAGNVKAAAVYLWASGGYTFTLNGKVVGKDSDNGTIEDYDIKPFLAAGENVFEIQGGGEAILEGAAVLDDGTEVHFRTDKTWNGGKANVRDKRSGGPRGYGGLTHNGRILTVTAEQKAKALVNGLNSARRRILDRDRFELWRKRDPRELLDLTAPTDFRRTWARIETLIAESRPAGAKAVELILAGKYGEVADAAKPAVEKTAEAERLLKGLRTELIRRTGRRAGSLSMTAREGARKTFNKSDVNRLGWVASAEPLDNDPLFWEFDLAPPGARTLSLAGRWQFRTDPDDDGVEEGFAKSGGTGWRSIYAPSKLGWERQDITQDNLKVPGRANKPYNGYAWYRKTLHVPAEWKGADLVLCPGVEGNNVYWLAVNGEFIHPTGADGLKDHTVTIPAGKVRFGAANTLALRVFNVNNFGGIVSPRLRLSRADAVPDNRRSACGMGIVRETVYSTPDGPVTQVAYSSALSPAVVVAIDGKVIRIAGWEARGYAAPAECLWAIPESGIRSVALGGKLTARPEIAGMQENWLLLRPAGASREAPRPLLVVFERKPTTVKAGTDAAGACVELHFDKPGARVALLPLVGGSGRGGYVPDLARIRLWSKALLRYPIGYTERVTFDGKTCKVRMVYEYLGLADSWGVGPMKLAPLPMLFSYAMEHHWPDAKPEGELVDLGCRAESGYYPQSDCGTYRAALKAEAVAYSFDRREPPRHLKGAGTLGEELRRPEMWENFVKWGFNSCRPQIQFYGGRGWPSFFQTPGVRRGNKWNENSKVVFGGDALETFDKVLKWHREHDLVFIINWFWNYDRPENEPHRAIVNSSRYWHFAPAVRRHIIDIWTKIAQHCKDLPPDAVIHDFLNEPSDVYWKDYNPFMKDISAAMRKVDKVHYLAQEAGGGWAQSEDWDMTEPTGDTKTLYEFHFYGPHTGDCHRYDLWFPRYQLDRDEFRSREQIEERILPVIRFSIRNGGAEMFHGEFGTSFIGPQDAPNRWLEALLTLHEKYRNHWNWWNYSGDNINRTGLIAGERVNPLVPTLSKYARMKASRRDAAPK